jgi:ABC-2 type transport system ATP-binding protein
MNNSPINAIQINALTKEFESFKAIDNLSLEVSSGTIFGFLGPNGAGKTTTIRLLLGMLTPSSGNGQVLGFDIQAEADQIRAQTGAMLEHTGIYERLSAVDNLEFYGRINRMPSEIRKNRIRELLLEVDLWERKDDLAGCFSRGMKQRLALARVLLPQPKLIFLDEPTAGLDVVSAAKIRKKLENLVEKEKLTVFLTSHNMSEVEQICSQVCLIKEGKLITQGSPDELRSMRDTQHLLIEGKGFTDSILTRLNQRSDTRFMQRNPRGLELDILDNGKKSDLVAWLVKEGVQIDEIRQENHSLEDVFITLMEEENVA